MLRSTTKYGAMQVRTAIKIPGSTKNREPTKVAAPIKKLTIRKFQNQGVAFVSSENGGCSPAASLSKILVQPTRIRLYTTAKAKQPITTTGQIASIDLGLVRAAAPSTITEMILTGTATRINGT